MRGARLFLEAAKRHGVKHVFGIVGGEASAILFNEVPGITFCLTRHEFAAGIMADVYARLTGLPQICYSTFGPGMTNLTTGVASAMLDRSPMIAVSAQVDTPEIVYNHTHQCLDNAGVMRPITKFAHEIRSVEEITWAMSEAAKLARVELPGPTFLSFPRDIMLKEIADADGDRLLAAMPSSTPEALAAPPKADIDWLAAQIKAAKHPIALGGNLLIREDACAELREFAERFGVPVCTGLASKGILPESHPFHIGPVNKYLDGILHQPVLDRVFGDCDLMLLLGFDFAEDVKPPMWLRNPSVRTLTLGPMPNAIEKVFQPEREVIGSLRAGLKMLVDRAPKTARPPPDYIREVRDLKARSGESPIQQYPTPPPQGIVKSVRSALGVNGIMCTDIGLHKQYAGLFSATDIPNTFMCSNGCGTFGFGLPAGLGAKIAFPDRRVAVVCGDGGFHSTSHDLETAVRFRLPIVVIVCKDNSFGLIKHYQLSGQQTIFHDAVDFGDVNFVQLAQANGWVGHFVTSRDMLEERLEEAFTARKPTLLEVPVRYQYRF